MLQALILRRDTIQLQSKCVTLSSIPTHSLLPRGSEIPSSNYTQQIFRFGDKYSGLLNCIPRNAVSSCEDFWALIFRPCTRWLRPDHRNGKMHSALSRVLKVKRTNTSCRCSVTRRRFLNDVNIH